MKRLTLLIVSILICLPAAINADNTVNLTPLPMQMTVGDGKLTLPESFTIEAKSEAEIAEATKFATLFAKVTGRTVDVKNEAPDALIRLASYAGSEELGEEGYTLDVTADGITITANSAGGYYYAFQSLKKMLPANVMAEVADEKVAEYSLPIVSIVDKPRFEYRGFMLDVSRHYFSMDQIKRMIDVMSYYKLNRFHWHLTDDQGWRLEIKKYPRLTTVGATRSDSWSVDPDYGGYYTNEPYGPYFYTQDECREIVAYAAERHIEVVPEVEFPGHSCAVNTAYPEFSCNPNGAHSVQTTGGIFSDVLNVANPEAVQFVKDVIDEVIEIFPYEQIHIGGDETPTSAWQNNAECQAMMQKFGMTNVRQLQSHFVREISDYATSKNRSVIMWNESLTASGTDEELIKGTGGMMMCWESGQVQPCALKAAQYGMKSVITPWGPYYINRKQSKDPGEPTGAGYGDDTVEATYNYVPVPASVPEELQKYYIGVQGTFWTEHVQSNYLLEYLALPRLIAIAETGWTPASKKDFADFQQRITKDTLLLDYNNYEYGRHFILDNKGKESKVMPVASTADDMTWYRIVTTATDARAGRCIQLLREGSSEIGTGNAQANRLWNSAIIENESDAGYDYQLWAFMQAPDNPERWAIVNKAKPNGSVKGTPTAENNTGRWDYDDNARHYDFILGDKVYAANGSNYNYSIRSQKVANTDMCLNYAGPGQTYSINLWNDPASGNGGIWEFRPLKEQTSDIVIDYPVAGKRYRIVNNTERFYEYTIYDNGGNSAIVAKQQYGADLWEVVDASTGNAGQTMKLRNVATGRYISGTAAPISLGESGAELTNAYNIKSEDFSIKVGEEALFPMPERATTNPGTLNKGGIYPQGTGWVYEEAYHVTYECYDKENNLIQKVYSSVPAGTEFTAELPHITNYEATEHTVEDNGEDKIVKVTYKRIAYSVTMKCYTLDGNLITEKVTPCTVGDSHTVEYPEVRFFTCIGSDIEENSVITPTEDTVIEILYECDGVLGAVAVGEVVTEIEDGASYLIFNAKDEAARSGFLSVGNIGSVITTTNSPSEINPGFVWTFNADTNGYKVVNNYGIYIPELNSGKNVNGSESGETFTFTLNSDGKTWSVKGTTNSYYWNGNADNTFTGWNDGHPFIIYSYKAHPYFVVSYNCIDENGEELRSASRYIKGGDSYTCITPIIDGYSLVASDAKPEELSRVAKNIEITLEYAQNETDIIEIETPDVEAEALYDLQGRKVENPIKGIYIVNGKKTIIM